MTAESSAFAGLTRRARVYGFSVLAAGWFCFLFSTIGWTPRGSLLQLGIYTIAAIVGSSLRIRLPGVNGTLSMNYAVILAALLNIDLASAMIVAVISTFGQCMIESGQTPQWFDVAFRTMGAAIPVLFAGLVAGLSPLARFDSNGILALLAASLVWFLTETAIASAIISLAQGKSAVEVWLRSCPPTVYQYLLGACLAGAVHFMNRQLGATALLLTIPPLYFIYHSFGKHLGRVEEQQAHISDMADLHVRTIETLALAIDAEDDAAAPHLRRIQIYALEIGKELNLSEAEMKALEAAAVLRDVGKLAVPEYIISKPGRLTPEEFEKMKIHPVVGAEILERVRFPYPVVPIVRSHHEKYDGTGYPDGLAGEQIPVGARILAAVDCLDALASDRKHRKAMTLEQAMQHVVMESGRSYDPEVVSILQRRFRDFEAKAREGTAEYAKLAAELKTERAAAAVSKRSDAPAPRRSNFSLAISSARREFQMLIEAMNDLGNSLRLDETLAVLGMRLSRIVAHDAIAIYLMEGDKLLPRLAKGESSHVFASLEIPVGEGLSGWVAESGLPKINGNPAVEFGYLHHSSHVTQLRSALAVPLQSEDQIIGVVTLYRLQAAAFGPDDLRLLLAMSPKAGLAIRNALRFERAESAADTDELTGLPNARYLFTHLQAEVEATARCGESVTLAVIDLDGFKAANDRYGHLTGNRILQAVAAGLRQNCRAQDLVARLGGDEFVIVMKDAAHQVEETLARIDRAIQDLSFDGDCEASIGFSAGIATCPEDGEDADTLLEKADERMYEAKRGKKLLRVA